MTRALLLVAITLPLWGCGTFGFPIDGGTATVEELRYSETGEPEHRIVKVDNAQNPQEGLTVSTDRDGVSIGSGSTRKVDHTLGSVRFYGWIMVIAGLGLFIARAYLPAIPWSAPLLVIAAGFGFAMVDKLIATVTGVVWVLLAVGLIVVVVAPGMLDNIKNMLGWERERAKKGTGAG